MGAFEYASYWEKCPEFRPSIRRQCAEPCGCASGPRRRGVQGPPHRRLLGFPARARRSGERRPRNWLASEHVLIDYVFPRFGGLDWYSYIAERYCTVPREKALVLCCGKGELERGLFATNICRNFDGVDISPEAIEICRREAAGLDGVFSYRVADLENITLPEQRYDLVFGWMALHHVRNLSGLYTQVRGALRPGGVFIVNEYVGPPRFRMSKAAVRMVNEWQSQLPEELRRLWWGPIRDHFDTPVPSEVAARDPSEAVASDRILPLLEQHFTILERIDYGGTVVHWALCDILQNFDFENAEHRGYLERLYEMEREAMRAGVIESDFAFLVAGAG